MSRRTLIVLALVALLALLETIPALAGGWAVITLDAWPGQVTAGEPLEIGFTVRQHGRDESLMSGLTPTVTLRNEASGEFLIVEAVAEGKMGHYVASVTFPISGEWAWSIQAFTMDVPMPVLAVSGAAARPTQARSSALPALLLTGVVGLAGAGLASLLAWRKRARWALALAAAGLALGGFGLVSAAASQGISQPESLSPETISPASQEALGEALFIAKGCATCHVNRRVDAADIPFSMANGPVLTDYVVVPEYVRLWLANPKAIKPQTEMPTLDLSQAEIEALIAFLISE